jgi:ATP-binding cassette subfamily C (CFTR/MRP) protein 1
LLCLARAILRRSALIILDEATASIDVSTDMLIQKTIRTEFINSTVITIAHRISTVLDCDRIMVLEMGRLAEFDTPKNLLADSQSLFYNLATTTNRNQ